MKQNFTLLRIKTFCVISILSTLFYLGCTKLDLVPENSAASQKTNSDEFFASKGTVTPSTKKIIEFLRIRNDKKEFVTDFGNNNGYAIWDKSLEISTKGKSSGDLNQSSFINNSANSNDTIVYIPIVLNGQNSVNGFIRATVNDSISVSYSLAQDYKNYPVISNNSVTASQFASAIMYFDNRVFNHQEFSITDQRIFGNGVVYDDSSFISRKVRITPNENNSVLALICYTNTVWTISANWHCQGCSGACDACTEYCVDYSVSSHNEITCNFEEIGGGNPGTGGGTSSGGGPIPHIYPCDPNIVPIDFGVLPGDPLPPCPAPGSGTGFTPIPSGVNQNGYYYSRIWQLDSMMLNSFAAIPCDSLELLNTFGSMFQGITNHKVPFSVLNRLDSIKLATPNFDTSSLFVQTLNNAAGSVVNCDFFPLKIDQLPIKNIQTGERFTPSEFLEYFRKNINSFSTNNVIFEPYNSNGFNDIAQNFKDSINSLGSVIHIDMQQNGSVILSGYQNNYSPNYLSLNFTFSTLITPLDGYHPVSGNRRFGIYTDINGGYTFYTMGVDRISRNDFAAGDWAISLFGPSGFAKADLLWSGMQSKVVNFITANNGTASLYTRPNYKIRPKWSDIEDFLKGIITFEQLKAKLCP